MRALVLPVLLMTCVAHAQDGAWPGEQRRVRFGVGLRTLGGAMWQRESTFLALESQLTLASELRVGPHHALRLQLGLAAGWPHTVEGETNLSFRFGLSPRWMLGAGVFGVWGFFGFRGGVEVPLVVRFGGRRAHELGLSVRASPGVSTTSPSSGGTPRSWPSRSASRRRSATRSCSEPVASRNLTIR